MRKNDAFVAKIVNTRLTKGFMAIFASAESLPSPATLMMTRMRRNDAQKFFFFEVALLSAAPLISFPLYLESVSLFD